MPSRRGRGCRLFCCDAFSGGERLGITWLFWSEVLEELQELVGGAVAARSGAGRGGAVQRALLESEVAVEVAAGGVFLFVLDMRVICGVAGDAARTASRTGYLLGVDTRWARSGGRPEGGRSGAPTACAPSGGGSIVVLFPVEEGAVR